MDPRPLALVRITLPLLILYDQLWPAFLGQLPWFTHDFAHGGLGRATPTWYVGASMFGEPHAGLILWATTLACLVCVSAGWFTRPALALVLFSWSQLTMLHPTSDRAIDHLVRTTFLWLLLSDSDRAYTIGGRRRVDVSSWPADLIRWLLVMMYLSAGWVKVLPDPSRWFALTDHAPVYRVMTQPVMGYWDAATLEPAMPLFWVAGWVTVVMELSAPLLLTRYRAFWAVFGAALHVGLALSVDLGIFSLAMLCFYPLIVPDHTVRLLDRLEARFGRPG